MMPLPIASICFSADQRAQILQAISVDRLVDHTQISRYTIVVNDPNEQRIADLLQKALESSLSSSLTKKLEILRSEEVLGNKDRDSYYDQQAIKLLLADAFTEPAWLMLDAKNHVVHPIDLRLFFCGPDDKLLMNTERTKPYWERYLKKSLSAVNATELAVPTEHLSSVTPIMMDRKIASELTTFVREKYGVPLPLALKRTGGTEFLLYYAWILKNDYLGRFEKGPPPFRTLFTSWPQDPGMVEQFIKSTGANSPILGLHRNRVPQLTAGQLNLLSAKWHEHLLQPWESSEWFLR